MSDLLIRLTRISPTHHRFSYRNSAGVEESLEFETKSYLFHDLLHFAYESEAGLKHSFYGLLAAGRSYAEFTPMTAENPGPGEIGMTERVVGGLTGYLKGKAEPKEFLSIMENMLSATGETLPAHLTEELLLRIKERMRRLEGEWNGTPFGQAMELKFAL